MRTYRHLQAYDDLANARRLPIRKDTQASSSRCYSGAEPPGRPSDGERELADTSENPSSCGSNAHRLLDLTYQRRDSTARKNALNGSFRTSSILHRAWKKRNTLTLCSAPWVAATPFWQKTAVRSKALTAGPRKTIVECDGKNPTPAQAPKCLMPLSGAHKLLVEPPN